MKCRTYLKVARRPAQMRHVDRPGQRLRQAGLGAPRHTLRPCLRGEPRAVGAYYHTPDLKGMIAEFEEVEGLSAAGLALLVPIGGRAEWAAAARRWVVETCDWRVVGAEHLEKIYRPLL